MSTPIPRPCELRRCATIAPPKTRPARERDRPHPPRLRHLREHATTFALIGVIALVALPPLLVRPSNEAEVIATVALTALTCLVALICWVGLRRR